LAYIQIPEEWNKQSAAGIKVIWPLA